MDHFRHLLGLGAAWACALGAKGMLAQSPIT